MIVVARARVCGGLEMFGDAPAENTIEERVEFGRRIGIAKAALPEAQEGLLGHVVGREAAHIWKREPARLG